MKGLFTGQDFVYDAEADHYTCPAGEHLTKGAARSDRREEINHYRMLDLRPQAQVHARQAEAGEALAARRRARQDAGPA